MRRSPCPARSHTAAGSEQDAGLLLEAIAQAVGDAEWRDRVRAAKDSVAGAKAGKKLQGLPYPRADHRGHRHDQGGRVARPGGDRQLRLYATGTARRQIPMMPGSGSSRPAPRRLQMIQRRPLPTRRSPAFAEQHADDLRYVATLGKWLCGPARAGRSTTRSPPSTSPRHLPGSGCPVQQAENRRPRRPAAKTVAAVEKLAKADRRLAATADQWDADLDLLNTQGG